MYVTHARTYVRPYERMGGWMDVRDVMGGTTTVQPPQKKSRRLCFDCGSYLHFGQDGFLEMRVFGQFVDAPREGRSGRVAARKQKVEDDVAQLVVIDGGPLPLCFVQEPSHKVYPVHFRLKNQPTTHGQQICERRRLH